LDIVNSKIAEFDQRKSSLEDNISLEEFQLDSSNKGSDIYRERLNNLIALRKEQEKYINDAQWYVQYQLDSNKKLNAEQRNGLSNTLDST